MPISSRAFVQSTTALLIVGFLALAGIVGLTFWLGERAQVYFKDIIHARDARQSAVELRDAVQTAESSQRGFLFTGNEIYLAPYDAAKALALRHRDAVARLLARDKDYAPSVQRLTSIITEKFDEMDQSIALKRNRQDADALALVRTNRGKALMDEANVFFSGIIRAADDRLTTAVGEQQANATWLRWVSLIGGIIIVAVVGAAAATVLGYTRALGAARDQVSLLNAGLEERVKQRTSDLARARDRAEVLLSEVNHRVANSLALVASLVKLQSNAVQEQAAKKALSETEARIYAISSVHKRLYSSGDVRLVALDEYLSGILDHLATSMREEGQGASLRYDIEPLKLSTDASINLGVVVTELITNAFKYAYPNRPGEVRVRLKRTDDGRIELVVEDDGVGRNENGPVRGTGLGTRIVNAMAVTMGAEIEYVGRDPGTAARLTFPETVD
jgi:two-component sensor histidine kinase/CHASE3 domain sensor protein